MTAAAVVASFYIRFEAAGLVERLRRAVHVPARLRRLCRDRLFPVPSLRIEVAVRLAARPDEHRSRRRRCWRCRCWCSTTCWSRRTCSGSSSSAKSPSRSIGSCRWCFSAGRGSPIAISAIPAPAITRARRSPIRRSCSDAPPTPKCCCGRSKAARSRRSGRSASCRRPPPTRGRAIRGIPVLGDFDALDAVVNDCAQRDTHDCPRGLHAVGVRARTPSRKRP